MIIYAPLIGDIIPGFTTHEIKIPYQHNPAVYSGEVAGYKLWIKNYVNSTTIKILDSAGFQDGTIVFNNFDRWKPEAGQYYKFQIAYYDKTTADGNNLAWSTAAIGKCLGNLDTSITVKGESGQTLSENLLNIGSVQFTATFTSPLTSETIEKYRFYIKEKDTNIIVEDSGELLHNSSNDEILTTSGKRRSTERFVTKYELESFKYYYLVFSCITINGFETTKSYPIIRSGHIPSLFTGELLVEQDNIAKDNGYIKISLRATGNEKVRGEFELQRSADEKVWETLTSFSLTYLSDYSNFTWKDWSIEQGVRYVYAIRQISNNTYSARIKSKPIVADFEDMFLSDGKRQLKIAFDPKVSSFKTTILESKTDTIGGKYPFFFRNGNVKYKEIPISGLISYLMDEDKLFMSDEELGLFKADFSREEQVYKDAEEQAKNFHYYTTNLTNYNIGIERKFKLAVLEWLTNGELKLFRSPAEGNYVVRLMNTSLSPNDTLGRMIHTFSSTAYESAAADIETLLDKRLIELPELSDPAPQPCSVTYTFDKKFQNQDTTVELFDENEMKKIIGVIWTGLPSTQYAIQLKKQNEQNAQNYYNTSGTFKTPVGIEYNSCVITKDSDHFGDSITLIYEPNITDYLGTNEFEIMIQRSADVLFSSVSGNTLREDNADLILSTSGNAINCRNIYYTYTMVVRKDPTYTSADPNDYKLYFWDDKYGVVREDVEDCGGTVTEINCSDGLPRYYHDINNYTLYEKGPGLHMDIYARLGDVRTLISSRLGELKLGEAPLGGQS